MFSQQVFFNNRISNQTIYIFFHSNPLQERGHGAMSKIKIVELVVLAGAALLSAAKYVLKFIDYIFKARNKNTVASAA